MDFSTLLELPTLADARTPNALEAAVASLAKLAASPADAAARDVHPDPTEAQKASGNYRKGHFSWKGLALAIETAAGQFRRGVGKDGKPWATKLKDHYGYVKGTVSGADDDPVDVFMDADSDLSSELVFVVNQVDPDTGRFDEHKCVLGTTNAARAKEVYLRNYSPGWKGLGSVTAITLDHFKWWLENADTSKEVRNGYFAAAENRRREKRAAADPLSGDAPKPVSGWDVEVDRPKGFKKTFHTAAGPKELTYPLDYGYFRGVVNPEDGEDADVFVGSGGPHYGRFMKGKPGPAGGMVPDERKWYGRLTPEEYQSLKSWWETEHDKGLTWDWTDLKDEAGLLADAGVTPAAAKWAAATDGPFTIAVDLDGTLAEQEEPFDPKSVGRLRKGARRWLQLFRRAGARIIIFTVRGDTKLVTGWLDGNRVPYDFVNENPDQPPGGSGKVFAHCYLDDRAVDARSLAIGGAEVMRRLRRFNRARKPVE